MTTTIRARSQLVQHSIHVIRSGQDASGAYLAAPTFPTYRYSWFRDGAFIADAMDLHGEHDSSAAFHAWAIRTLSPRLTGDGDVIGDTAVLHTRYLPDGSTGQEDWPNFQLDGLGTWLWAFRRHLAGQRRAPSDQEASVVRRLAMHLKDRWSLPNFDCWEENEDRVHPSTLGALYAGLEAAADLLSDRLFLGVAHAIRAFVLAHGVHEDHFVKHVGEQAVDANLIWLSLPYGLVAPHDPLSLATVRQIRDTIQDEAGGVHRYANDTYYGGGSWLLLTCDLAQLHLTQGNRSEAERLRAWVESRATESGDMPEQVADNANAPGYIRQWQELWGESACPLLWSHAAYLRLVHALSTGTADR